MSCPDCAAHPSRAPQGWSGDTSGCALLLCAIESSWSAVASRQAQQQEGSAYADAAATRIAASAATRRDAWRPLEMELARLPELSVGMQEAAAMAGRLLSRLEAISAAMDAAEAAAWAAPLAAREAAAVRAAAAAEQRHANDLALLAAEGEKRRRWAASRAALASSARIAPGVLPRRLRVGPAGDARRLANVEVDLSEATASLLNFLENSPSQLQGGEARPSRCVQRQHARFAADAVRSRPARSRRHKERGADSDKRPDGERRRRHRKKGLDYLDYKGAHRSTPRRVRCAKAAPDPVAQAIKTRYRWRCWVATT